MRACQTPLVMGLVLGLALCTPAVWAGATFSINVVDAAGEGFNDPTPATPVGGNPGTTVGEQRLLLFQEAGLLWGQILQSDVVISIQSSFDPLTCGATGATLGAAGALQAFMDFPNAPLPGTWYHSALADSLAGSDLGPGDDLVAFFNSSLDTGCLPGVAGWYYGFDGNPPADRLDLLPVLLHEFAHGMGFANFINETTGAFFGGFPDVYSQFTFDNTTGETWANMATDGDRAASALNCRQVSWNGAAVTAEAPNFLNAGTPFLSVTSPASVAGDYTFGAANFGPPLTSPGVSGTVVLADDGNGTLTDACEGQFTGEGPWANGGAIAGNIAFVDRGTCDFFQKVRNAQEEGAIGVIVSDNATGCPPPNLGGSDPDVTIPSGRLSLMDGNAIRAELPGVTAILTTDLTTLTGTHPVTGQVLLFATNPVQQGSSISHFEASAFPNLLMEPALAVSGGGTDLTFPAFSDEGWQRMPLGVAIPGLDWRGMLAMSGLLMLLAFGLLRRTA